MKKILIAFALVLAVLGSAEASIPLDGARADVGFSPDEGSLDLVLYAIRHAKKSINLAAYDFTSKPIAFALLDAQQRGVDVRVVMDKKRGGESYSTATFLANKGIAVRANGNYPIAHSKIMVIDDVHVETGSFNYTAGALKNAENVLVLWNVPELAAAYKAHWRKLWDGGEDVRRRY